MSGKTIYIIDDDLSVRTALSRLLRSMGWGAESFASASDFLNRNPPPPGPGCILLDVRMPDLSGLDLQKELRSRKISTPIIFLSGQADIPISVQAMKAGAVDFLTKPVEEKALLESIQQAFEKDQRIREANSAQDEIRQRLQTLTPREREVLRLVIQGRLNKEIADELGASEKTIKVHRARVMQKMRVVSVAELVQDALKLGIA